MKHLFFSAATLAVCLPFHLFASTLGQATTPAGAVFVGACSGNQIFGSGNSAGDAYNGGNSTANATCTTATSTVGGSVSVDSPSSGVANGYSYTNDASGFGSPGLLHLQADNTASAPTTFAGAEANIGFNDMNTISNGTGNAVWVLNFWVDGLLSATTPGSLSELQIAVYSNFNAVNAYGADTTAYNIFNSLNTIRNGDIGSSWDTETIEWGATGAGTTSLPVGQFVHIAIPFTYGTAFEYGIYASVWVTQSSGGFAGQTVEAATFDHTIAYDSSYVVQDGNTITDFTVTSAAGLDYSQSLVTSPEPSAIFLSATALLALCLLRRNSSSRGL